MKRLLYSILPFGLSFSKFMMARYGVSYWTFLKFKFIGGCIYFPIDSRCLVANPRKIFVGINALVGRPGNYIQGAGGIYIGNYVQLAPNVGILSANHDLYDQTKYNLKPVFIGDYSWIGMNSVVLPGVTLGPRTIVAAGSVVTKSFPDGYCVVGGNPAKLIKNLDSTLFHPWKYKEEYYGYIPKEKFRKHATKYLDENFLSSIDLSEQL